MFEGLLNFFVCMCVVICLDVDLHTKQPVNKDGGVELVKSMIVESCILYIFLKLFISFPFGFKKVSIIGDGVMFVEINCELHFHL